MNERIQTGLRRRRWMQIAGWASLIGLVGCFLVLLLLEIEGLAHFQVCRYYQFFCGELVETLKLDFANLESLLRTRDADARQCEQQ